MSAPPQPLEAETARVEEQCYNAVVAGGREVNVARLRLEPPKPERSEIVGLYIRRSLGSTWESATWYSFSAHLGV